MTQANPIHQHFMDSVSHVFSTMLGQQLTIQKPSLMEHGPSNYQVSATVGISGDVAGVILLGCSAKDGQAIVEKMVHMPMKTDSEDFADAIGEIINMIAGNAKARMNCDNASISCPTVVADNLHRIYKPSGMNSYAIRCQFGDVAFMMELTLSEAKSASATQEQAA